MRSMKTPNILPSPVRAMGGSPVVSKKNSNNKSISNSTLLNGNSHRILPGPGGKLARICLPGSHLAVGVDLEVEAGAVNQDAVLALPRSNLNINDNYCLTSPVLVARTVDGVLSVQRQKFHVSVQQPVLCPVVSPVPFVLNVRGQSQKKDGSPSSRVKTEINFVKSVFSVDHCVCAPNVQSAHNVANTQLVGGRLQDFGQKWSLMGANPRVVFILRDGYILPFKIRPPLVRDQLIISGYANPLRNLYLNEALHTLIKKKAVERVRVRTSLANFGPQCSKQFFERKNIQNGNPGNNSDLLTTRGMGNIAGFQRCLFPHSNSHKVPEIPQVSLPEPILPISGPSVWPINSSDGVHLCDQRSQVDGSVLGYKNPPVPR